jgi:hypothetical protein
MVRLIQELKKQLDKSMDKYDVALSKWCAIPKAKDSKMLVETYHALIDCKKQYLTQSFDFVFNATRVLRLIVPFINEVLLPGMNDFIEYTNEMSLILGGLKKMSLDFKNNWSADEELLYSSERILEESIKWKHV